MLIKGNKFDFYIPDITALDILKGIMAFVDKDKKYTCNPVKYNHFFQTAIKNYPEFFKDITIEEDDFLPYSEDIEYAYTSASEFNIINRPNPDIYPCKIVATDARLEKIFSKYSAPQIDILKNLAVEFERQLQEQ